MRLTNDQVKGLTAEDSLSSLKVYRYDLSNGYCRLRKAFRDVRYLAARGIFPWDSEKRKEKYQSRQWP